MEAGERERLAVPCDQSPAFSGAREVGRPAEGDTGFPTSLIHGSPSGLRPS